MYKLYNSFKLKDYSRYPTDLGDRCPYCLEYDNWIVESEDGSILTVRCNTKTYYDDGEYAGLCGCSKDVRNPWA